MRIKSNVSGYIALILMVSGIISFIFSCTKYYYGNAVNKAFVKPLEREYRSYERMIKRNGGNNPNYPYLLSGKLIDDESNLIMFGVPIEEGSYYRSFTDMEGNFKLSIADSQFIKNKFILKINIGKYEYEPAEFVFMKNDFKNNYLDTTLVIFRKKIYLD